MSSKALGRTEAELKALFAALRQIDERLAARLREEAASGGGETARLLRESRAGIGRAEQLTRTFAAQRDAIADSLPTNIALLDAEGDIVEVNSAWRAFFEANGGRHYDHFVGENYKDVCRRAVARGSRDAERALDGIDRVLGGRADHFAMHYACFSPSEERWFEMTVAPLRIDGIGGAVVSHRNVTESHLANRRARDLQERLLRLVEKASIGILVHAGFEPLLVNAELVSIFGYRSEADLMALRDVRLLFDPKDVPRLERFARDRVLGGDAPEVYTARARRRDGRAIMIENRAFTIPWGDRLAICAMVTDVTERLESEERTRQSQRLQALGQLTGGIAHDFNNLLTVILGSADVLTGELADDGELLELARMVGAAAERGADLTRRLLTFGGRQQLQPSAIDVAEHVTTMEPLLRRSLGELVEIEIGGATARWPAFVDASQLEIAVLNLCINARDAMPRGGRITIETDSTVVEPVAAGEDGLVAPGDYVVVRVRDTGTGMSPEVASRAFEPFFTTKEPGKGTGLGLSMVFGFAQQSGGRARIRSQLGAGTTVEMLLPRACDAPRPALPSDREVLATRDGNRTVMVVEDDDLVRQQAEHILSSLGYATLTARTAHEALAAIEGGRPVDLLFTDMVLPGDVGGIELAARAKRLRPDLPVLFTTGYADASEIARGLGDGEVQVLRKPYRRIDLARLVHALLEE
ncbi:ATP-binding protein [Aquibium sp. A9E412]|uniref:ATP-binding protein n=1 Tax=Aquibium sp. A9E412 TaxID=2976767 RepID=UPI0025AF626E|nr:ATP-binding protein [Aquibium sp. A9E412]MDN2564835.1 ATP-binding protein [Aquibium sp. A9E412]